MGRFLLAGISARPKAAVKPPGRTRKIASGPLETILGAKSELFHTRLILRFV